MAPSVVEAMQPYWSTHYMLPGQEHACAQAVCEALEHAREGLALLVGCEPFELVFTGGGTEANNLAVLGRLANRDPGHILVSSLEHDSVIETAKSLTTRGWEVEIAACGSDGLLDPDQFGSRLRDNTQLACVQFANPVLGTIQPVREIADVCHNRGVSLHCDATQAFGKMPVDVSQLRADTVAISGHKFYGPKGSGAIYVRKGLHLSPIAYGEPREMGLRAGPENIPLCIGLGAAAVLAARCATDVAATLIELRNHFCTGLYSTLDGTPRILCEGSPRLPNTVAFEMPGNARRIQRAARQLVLATAQSSSPPDEITRVLRAIGRDQSQIDRTLRISLGWTSSREQVDRAVELLADAWDGIRA